MERIREEEKTRKDFAAHDFLIHFIETGERHWWDYLFRTREGFRHCFVLQWDEWAQRWLMVDWRQSRTDFTIFFDFEIEPILREMIPAKGTVVRFRGGCGSSKTSLITYCSNIISRTSLTAGLWAGT